MLADRISEELERYVVFGGAQRDTVVLWVLHCWTIGAHYTTPRLFITSPEPECGKSTLLEVMELMLPNAISTTSISAAGIYQRLDAERPKPILIDEIDNTLFGKGALDSQTQQLVLAVLNTGYRRGRFIHRGDRDGKPRDYPSFAPVAVSGIKKDAPGTFMSRSITLYMDRGEPPQEWEFDEEIDAGMSEIRAACEAWAVKQAAAVKANRHPERPAGLTGRKAECWKPLLRVADALDEDWSKRARVACEELTLWTPPEDESPAHRMLVDCRTVFDTTSMDRMFTRTLVNDLRNDEETDWQRWNRGEGLDARALGRLLGKYNIHPVTVRIGDETAKGYYREAFEASWARYCPELSNEYGGEVREEQRLRVPSLLDELRHNPANTTGRVADNASSVTAVENPVTECDGVTERHETSDSGHADAFEGHNSAVSGNGAGESAFVDDWGRPVEPWDAR